MILDGKKIALHIEAELKEKIGHLQTRKPGLAVVLVGEHPASLTYIRMKEKRCTSVGINFYLKKFPSSISEDLLLEEIKNLNNNKTIDGILVQLPLPPHISTQTVIETIDPKKDVDCFHPLNMGKLSIGNKDGFIPCTPGGIQLLLKHANVQVEGKHVVVVGRSNLVGKPLAILLMQKGPHANATVTVAHSGTPNLKEICQSADILIVAIGSPLFIKSDMVKKGAVVIDVGIHKIQSEAGTKIIGDVDFEQVKDKCSIITPVPGGVGPMTIAMLLKNTYQSYLQHTL
ncbi:MAG: bifunctional methylenetetrahydrofolate dehydrogenase/methenyltetrahydrofolate cyclohydrolase FolD [Chlamydiales bacterium]|nr:bifunctional methylenetetrahydrofolate dehydrogenase/methenyltetrahydrofolate cyclohydrolase FolD [Chlamydiales bacterium]